MNHEPHATSSATEMAVGNAVSPPSDVRPAYPYPGLRPFEQHESAIFFGRGEQIGEMLTRLEDHRFLAVVGASGCGKSSLVRAGLLPALEQGFLAMDSDQWRFVIMRPGDSPLRNLASALATSLSPQTSSDEPHTLADQTDPHRVAIIRAGLRSGPKGLVEVVEDAQLPVDTNVLVLVDQFEELFRFRHCNKSLDGQSDERAMAAERDEAAALVSLLLATAAQRDRPIYVVITMRSDFLGDCDAFYGLPEAINDSQFLTPRMTRDQARDAIVEPARLFGGDVEPALVNRILNEIGNDPDQLPLMQHALMRAWRHAEKERGRPVLVQSADYERLGGLQKALSNHADYVLEHLESDADRRVAEMLFRALCDRSAEQRLTRRLANVGEIAAIAGVTEQDVIRVADTFRGSGRNFLTPPIDVPLTADSTLDISHESLIRQWDTLQTWLAREERSARIYRRLSETATLWQAGYAGLYRAPDLDVAIKWKRTETPTAAWAKRYGGDFRLNMRFLDMSESARMDRKLLTKLIFAAVTLLAIFAVWRWYDSARARQQTVDILKNQLEMYTNPTVVGGDVVSALSRKSPDLLAAASASIASMIPTSAYEYPQAIAEQIAILDKTTSDFDWNNPDSAARLQEDVLRLAKACRLAWENRASQLSEPSREMARDLVIRTTYERAIQVSYRISNGAKTANERAEFERLYWSELVFLETKEVESVMVAIRSVLEKQSTADLKILHSQLKTACEAAISSSDETLATIR